MDDADRRRMAWEFARMFRLLADRMQRGQFDYEGGEEVTKRAMEFMESLGANRPLASELTPVGESHAELLRSLTPEQRKVIADDLLAAAEHMEREATTPGEGPDAAGA